MRRLIALLLLLIGAPAAAQEVSVTLSAAADGTRTMIHEVIVPGRRKEVWRAVSTTAGWRSWAVPLARDVPGTDRFETSYDPAAARGAPSVIEQQWVARNPLRRVSFRTTRTPAGFPHSEAYRRVVSAIELAPVGRNATRVRLVASGYPAGAAGDALIRFFREGNRATLRQLHTRFASGPIDWAARLAGQKGE